MTNAFLKLLTAAGTAALLLATPVAAQDNGAGNGDAAGAAAGAGNGVGGGGADVVPFQDFDDRVTPAHRTAMSTAFRDLDLPPAAADIAIDLEPGAEIPATIETFPVPPEIVEAVPDTAGYEYVTLPDGRIALIHPDERVVAMVLD